MQDSTASLANAQEQEALALFQVHCDALFRHCYLRTVNRETGKELMEHTFRRLWKYMQEGHSASDLESMLYRIANGLIKEHRAKKSETKRPLFTNLQKRTVRHKEDKDVEQLLSFLQELPENERDAVVLHFVDHFSLAQTAGMIGERVNDVKRHTSRANQTMENLLIA